LVLFPSRFFLGARDDRDALARARAPRPAAASAHPRPCESPPRARIAPPTIDVALNASFASSRTRRSRSRRSATFFAPVLASGSLRAHRLPVTVDTNAMRFSGDGMISSASALSARRTLSHLELFGRETRFGRRWLSIFCSRASAEVSSSASMSPDSVTLRRTVVGPDERRGRGSRRVRPIASAAGANAIIPPLGAPFANESTNASDHPRRVFEGERAGHNARPRPHPAVPHAKSGNIPTIEVVAAAPPGREDAWRPWNRGRIAIFPSLSSLARMSWTSGPPSGDDGSLAP